MWKYSMKNSLVVEQLVPYKYLDKGRDFNSSLKQDNIIVLLKDVYIMRHCHQEGPIPGYWTQLTVIIYDHK